MKKVSVDIISNKFCPQALFMYGTYKEDGTPNFGLFCWFSYCAVDGLGVMACIGEEKLTKDRIRATGVFSANLVSEELLPLADYFGTNSGYNPDKMSVPVETMEGEVLHVPIIKNSPVSFELEVVKSMELGKGSDLFVCKIRNVMVDERLTDEGTDDGTRMMMAAPVVTMPHRYFSIGKPMGSWGDWKNKKLLG